MLAAGRGGAGGCADEELVAGGRGSKEGKRADGKGKGKGKGKAFAGIA